MRYSTIFHSLAEQARKITPKVNSLRGVTTAIVTPFLWTQHTGHWKSCLKQKAVDAHGEPLIWYTYPAIHFLEQVDFRGKRVMELGAGNSTFWWAKRAEWITALEGDPSWFKYLKGRLPENVTLHLTEVAVPPTAESIALGERSAPYDVIVIDGFDRAGFAEVATKWLNPDGIIIFDDSDGAWSHNGTQEYLENFRGFQRVDYYGYAPNGSVPHCTSIFFKESFAFFNRPSI
ncbi:MAG TPA: class I SAM-dependent methyltransferase [Pyrinomonadaceae bacterium]|jgi:hypothetical protein|nr:class I SAM-dependent methyltransferase [Pyrinomonadaceae bacterium]